ncbi:MAG TPA: hypothetical protein VNQ90_08045 [Chthoniobacteraceae bacterium]|nr:hypothetical protein [Chthoniobacteraceae bacterium]
MELSSHSSTLILGYGGGEKATRKELLPYFHVCGAGGGEEPVRALIVGGWSGEETTTTYAIARFLASIEERLRLVSGIEVTAYPIANLEARRAGIAVTPEQEKEGVRFWCDSPFRHVRALENELRRYSYDLVIILREAAPAADMEVNVWPDSEVSASIVRDALNRYASAGTAFSWAFDPENGPFPRIFTPLPESGNQPTEVLIALPGSRDQEEQANQGMGLLLTMLHAARQAKAEGVL